jgi:biopolymer transport protein ExbB
MHSWCVLAAVAFAALAPAQALAWWNDEWTGRKQFAVDTSAAGANVTEAIGPAVVLVRLHSGNFKLEAAKEDGSDLRFVAEDDKTPLKFHLEKFDPLLGEALAWVALPDVKPGARTSFWIYYGNQKAAPAEDMKGTFDPGTALVYHFTEKDQPARDSSPWGNQAAAAGKAAEGALIGRGLRLDGAPVTIPAGASLQWAAGAPMTWSLWVKPSAASQAGLLFARHDGDRAFMVGLDAGKPYVEVRGPAGVVRSAATSTLAAASWHQVAVTAGPQGLVIWVDGVAEGRAQAALPALGTVSYLGGDAPGEAPPAAPPRGAGGKGAKPGPAAAAPAQPFVGDVDELEISKVERPPGLLRVAAISQGTDPSKLVVAGAEEEGSSWSSGYMAIILRSVTPDGWVVIGLLGIMAVVSWMVMVGKSSYLSQVHRANEKFLERFRSASGELARFVEQTRQLQPAEALAFKNAPLHRIFQAGAEEIRKRSDGTRPLHAEAIEAIRATLDAALVRENLRVQSSMVLLTIAISGGPFLGLLGTVVGVMITFASIAAAGDVNVNAIAPGIAAALVATVAGLAVAIPALFGYNWLLTRAKSSSAVMQVFVDEMITKIAEAYSERAIAERRGPHLARVD